MLRPWSLRWADILVSRTLPPCLWGVTLSQQRRYLLFCVLSLTAGPDNHRGIELPAPQGSYDSYDGIGVVTTQLSDQ